MIISSSLLTRKELVDDAGPFQYGALVVGSVVDQRALYVLSVWCWPEAKT